MPSVWVELRRSNKGKSYIVRWQTTKDGQKDRGSIVCGPSKGLADKVRAKKLEELYHRKAGLPVSVDSPPWPEFAALYLSHSEKHKAPRTFRNFDKRAMDLFGVFIGKRSPAGLTHADISEWETRLLEAYSPNTVRIWLRAVRTALRWGKRQGYIGEVPDFPMPKAVPVGRSLSDGEIKLLFSKLLPHEKPPIIFALYTGVRRGEMLSLSWERIRKAQDGFWEAEIGGVGGPTTKTGKSRLIPLHPSAVKALGEPKTKGPVFKATDKISRSMLLAARRAGLGRVRFHDLRHTWATKFMQTTGDLFALMRLGGWRSMGSVAHYQHLTKARSESGFSMIFPTGSH